MANRCLPWAKSQRIRFSLVSGRTDSPAISRRKAQFMALIAVSREEAQFGPRSTGLDFAHDKKASGKSSGLAHLKRDGSHRVLRSERASLYDMYL